MRVALLSHNIWCAVGRVKCTKESWNDLPYLWASKQFGAFHYVWFMSKARPSSRGGGASMPVYDKSLLHGFFACTCLCMCLYIPMTYDHIVTSFITAWDRNSSKYSCCLRHLFPPRVSFNISLIQVLLLPLHRQWSDKTWRMSGYGWASACVQEHCVDALFHYYFQYRPAIRYVLISLLQL